MRDDVLATLNELIEVCRDGEAGFKSCAKDIHGGQLTQPFLRLAYGCNDVEGMRTERRACAEKLPSCTGEEFA